MTLYKYFKTEGPWSDADVKLLSSDTGSWRTVRPVVNMEGCIFCGFCSLYCPVQCMKNRDDHFEPNLDYCKGCGVCAKECPKNVIDMKPEGDFL